MAGAVVHCERTFGDYQGEWVAKVTWKGRTGWVMGSYGTCCGCDAFKDAFMSSGNTGDNGEYHCISKLVKGYEKCKKLKAKMAAFGKEYLDSIMTQKEAEAAAVNGTYGEPVSEITEYLRTNRDR
jgi:hypothetical protein